MSIFEAEIDFPCPGCGHDIQETLGRLHVDKATICPACYARISLDDEGIEGLDALAEAIGAERRIPKRRGAC